MRQLFAVDGLVGVITGGGTGLGLDMAQALCRSGASKIYILGRRESVLQTAAKTHPNLHPIVCDVTSKPSLQSAVDTITAETGYINLLIANSGIVGPESSRFDPSLSIAALRKRLFEDVSMEDFTNVFHVNVTGAYYTMLAFLGLLDAGNGNAVEKNGYGKPLGEKKTKKAVVPGIQSQVIFTSSISAYSRMYFSAMPYSGSKAAVSHLTKHASTNLARYGIRVNGLAPGLFPTELAKTLIGDRDPSTEDPDEPRFIPARRFGLPEETAGTIVYMASRAGAYNNGMILVNDGGKLATIPSEY
ncbi:short chain dehydrogenase [Poronia punctata]|nr:short chain dehydrogenase [Poronia punctata]